MIYFDPESLKMTLIKKRCTQVEYFTKTKLRKCAYTHATTFIPYQNDADKNIHKGIFFIKMTLRKGNCFYVGI